MVGGGESETIVQALESILTLRTERVADCEMSNLSYHQPKMPPRPNRLLLRNISGHQSYVTSVAFFGPLRDRIITGSYDELAKVWCVEMHWSG